MIYKVTQHVPSVILQQSETSRCSLEYSPYSMPCVLLVRKLKKAQDSLNAFPSQNYCPSLPSVQFLGENSCLFFQVCYFVFYFMFSVNLGMLVKMILINHPDIDIRYHQNAN